MDRALDNLKDLVKSWKASRKVSYSVPLSALSFQDMLASICCPGDFYYFLWNVTTDDVEYVHPAVEQVLGCTTASFSADTIYQRMHPEDKFMVKNKEKAVVAFLQNRIPVQKIPFYKPTYTFRVSDGKGGWAHILHQSRPILVGDGGKWIITLTVHSNITFIHLPPDDRVSFIGLHGEPSFYAHATNPGIVLSPGDLTGLSERERQIVKCLAEGLSSKDIAVKLEISRHTVDTHRRNLLKRFGANNTLELAAICIKRSLI